MRLPRTVAWTLLLIFASSGCTTMPTWQPVRTKSVELREVPFVAQTTDQCGPASLAMVLKQSGIGVSADSLRERVYLPAREGALQVELLAAARDAGRIAYVIEPQPDALLSHLDDGRPVLILQNLGIAWRTKWHYAVLIGYLPEDDVFVLRSGPKERSLMSRPQFLKTWRTGNQWGMVVLKPEEIPSNATENAYLRAVTALESSGQLETAANGYKAALVRWSDSVAARFGLANVHHRRNEALEAQRLYESVLNIAPDYLPALNNLALLHDELGQSQIASEMIDRAITLAEHSPILPTLLDTRAEITQSELRHR